MKRYSDDHDTCYCCSAPSPAPRSRGESAKSRAGDISYSSTGSSPRCARSAWPQPQPGSDGYPLAELAAMAAVLDCSTTSPRSAGSPRVPTPPAQPRIRCPKINRIGAGPPVPLNAGDGALGVLSLRARWATTAAGPSTMTVGRRCCRASSNPITAVAPRARRQSRLAPPRGTMIENGEEVQRVLERIVHRAVPGHRPPADRRHRPGRHSPGRRRTGSRTPTSRMSTIRSPRRSATAGSPTPTPSPGGCTGRSVTGDVDVADDPEHVAAERLPGLETLEQDTVLTEEPSGEDRRGCV